MPVSQRARVSSVAATSATLAVIPLVYQVSISRLTLKLVRHNFDQHGGVVGDPNKAGAETVADEVDLRVLV